MFYDIYKLRFPYGVHFGERVLESTNNSFCADTLFSALCIEARKRGEEEIDKLYSIIKQGKLLISDAFPYYDKEYFLPKPFIKIQSESDSSKIKKYKNMKYVVASKWENFLEGKLELEYEIEIEKKIGTSMVKTSAAIRGNDNSMPYRIGKYMFEKKSGLYIIYGYDDDRIKDFFYDLLDGLSYSGIGGKRSSGMGRFEIYNGELPRIIQDSIQKESNRYITLSISLPTEDEMINCTEGASYMLKKRSGFVESSNYSDSYLRKKDLYMYSSGSCFSSRFQGDIYDVTSGGNHPVYRYGKPIFLGV